MRIEIGAQKPAHLKAAWDGQYEAFSHFEFACGIPHSLFAVTTLKENGQPNVCLHSWSSFCGNGVDGFWAVLGGISKASHTYQNIVRTGEFVVNFLAKDYFDGCFATIRNNKEEDDELAAGGFTAEKAKTVASPRIQEAFLCQECTLEKEVDLGGHGKTVLLIGKVNHIGMSENYAGSIDDKYGDSGFMFNINEPINLLTGESKGGAVAVCKVVRAME